MVLQECWFSAHSYAFFSFCYFSSGATQASTIKESQQQSVAENTVATPGKSTPKINCVSSQRDILAKSKGETKPESDKKVDVKASKVNQHKYGVFSEGESVSTLKNSRALDQSLVLGLWIYEHSTDYRLYCHFDELVTLFRRKRRRRGKGHLAPSLGPCHPKTIQGKLPLRLVD